MKVWWALFFLFFSMNCIGQNVIMTKVEYDSLINRHDRYRATVISQKQIIRKQNEVIAANEYKVEDLKYQIQYLSKEVTNFTEARIKREEEFRAEILKEKEAAKSVHQANRELNAKVMQTRRFRANVNVMRGGIALLALTSATLLIARNHD